MIGEQYLRKFGVCCDACGRKFTRERLMHKVNGELLPASDPVIKDGDEFTWYEVSFTKEGNIDSAKDCITFTVCEDCHTKFCAVFAHAAEIAFKPENVIMQKFDENGEKDGQK